MFRFYNNLIVEMLIFECLRPLSKEHFLTLIYYQPNSYVI
jgi:hypothetical protein